MIVQPDKAKASDKTKRLRRRMGLVVARRITDKVSCPPLAGQLDCRVSGRVEDKAAPRRDCTSKV